MRAQLHPLDGGNPIDILRDLVVVGRKEECDIQLEHKSVSKMHCVIVRTDGLLLLRDLGSTNGTRVNGTRVRRAALLPNDQLTIANYRFRVHLGPDALPESVDQGNTQKLDASDVKRLQQVKAHNDDDSSSELPPVRPSLLRNQLPDVYPDGAPPGDLG